ncbi:hypothetical protein FPY71_14000 [Aureimonas fodinaquatilis]|uniref:Uncharacterized protein n=1 Tax=Aureimonas fodinaquatilis TaxID=2565783 RepID=A0A5B0DV14_9HYPH|nr:hypothetical protein [Aureimonas fodinaquatilis]KAA0969631.1 hypothetical protein FPY71_14000 [Aureimonas fodinaquatilis]
MSNRNTVLFGASLLAAIGAVAVDYSVSDAPRAVAAQVEDAAPCAAATPSPASGARNYDDIANDYSSGSAPAPAPAPMPAENDANPCSAGVL